MHTPQSNRSITAIAINPGWEFVRWASLAFFALIFVAGTLLITSPAWADGGEGSECATCTECCVLATAEIGWPRKSDQLFGGSALFSDNLAPVWPPVGEVVEYGCGGSTHGCVLSISVGDGKFYNVIVRSNGDVLRGGGGTYRRLPLPSITPR
jgi:hypothetical protein